MVIDRSSLTYVVGGDGAGGVAGDKLDHRGHGAVDELSLRPDHRPYEYIYIYVLMATC
jgi:hypothetical protein